MEQPFDKFLMFRNRLEKVYRHLGRISRKQGISCYRLYDHDLPQFPFIIEVYEDKLYVAEYKRRHNLSEEEHEEWIEGCKKIMSEVLAVDERLVFMKLRKRKEGRLDQYQKLETSGNEFIVTENGLQFIVNLSDYLDTGLFLDHRITRQLVREVSKDKRVLNLFCYTGSFSVYAASGGASGVTSVDLSKTYLDWSVRNMQKNFPALDVHKTVHADVVQYLSTLASGSFDIIIMDPPTFSNSKRMEGILDVQRDHVQLINQCTRILSPGGILFFSTNYSKFKLQEEGINSSIIKDITRQTTPFDFEGKLKRQCFRITK